MFTGLDGIRSMRALALAGEMVRDPGGHMHGVIWAGGSGILGTVFEITP